MNYLILNLAVADIMVALFLVPRYIVSHTLSHPDGIAGTVLCKLLTGGILTWISLVVSVLTLVVIAFERYYVVMGLEAYQRQLTAKNLKVRLSVWAYVWKAFCRTSEAEESRREYGGVKCLIRACSPPL